MADLTTFKAYKKDYGTWFNFTTSYTATQTDKTILPSAGTGKSFYLTDMVISGTNVGSIELSTAPTGTSVTIFKSVSIPQDNVKVINLITPLKVTASSTLRLTSVGMGTHSLTLSGYKDA